MLVSCVAYEEGKKVGDISVHEISEYLVRPECLVWVALADPASEDLALMEHEFGLHELAVEDARHGHQRPKIDEYGNSLFVVLHTVAIKGDDLLVGEVAIFVGPNYVLSVRNGTERGFADVRARCEREPALLRHGAGYVLYALMDAVVDRYFPILDTLESDLETLEGQIFGRGSGKASLEALYGLKQKLMTLKHAVGPLLEGVSKLHGGRVPEVCGHMQEYFRDVSDHLGRINQSIDSIRDMVTTAMSVHLSLATMQENETTKRLAAGAALVAVPTLIAGVYGMNFENMPEIKWSLGYPVALALMIGIDVYLFWRFRRAGWL